MPGQELNTLHNTTTSHPPDFRLVASIPPLIRHFHTVSSSNRQELQPQTTPPRAQRPAGEQVVLAGGYTWVSKNTPEIRSLHVPRDQKRSRETKSQTRKRGISEVSGQGKQIRCSRKRKKRKAEARRPSCKDRAAVLNEGINESMPAGYLEMQIRFPTNQDSVLFWCLFAVFRGVSSLYFLKRGWYCSSSVRPRES